MTDSPIPSARLFQALNHLGVTTFQSAAAVSSKRLSLVPQVGELTVREFLRKRQKWKGMRGRIELTR